MNDNDQPTASNIIGGIAFVLMLACLVYLMLAM